MVAKGGFTLTQTVCYYKKSKKTWFTQISGITYNKALTQTAILLDLSCRRYPVDTKQKLHLNHDTSDLDQIQPLTLDWEKLHLIVRLANKINWRLLI